MGFIRNLDAKLVSSVVTIGLSRAVLALGGDPVGDPLYNSLISLALGAVVGWLYPNTGTVLRTKQEDGNPDPSKLNEAGQGLVELVIVLFVLVLIVLLVAPRL